MLMARVPPMFLFADALLRLKSGRSIGIKNLSSALVGRRHRESNVHRRSSSSFSSPSVSYLANERIKAVMEGQPWMSSSVAPNRAMSINNHPGNIPPPPSSSSQPQPVTPSVTMARMRRMKINDLRMELSFLGLSTKGDRGMLLSRLSSVLDDGPSRKGGHRASDAAAIPNLSPERTYVLRLKGTTTQNSGGAGVGLVLYDPGSSGELWAGRIYASGDRTPFEAEYSAVILGLDYVYNVLGGRRLVVQTNNEAIVKQITGVYKVAKSSLRVLLDVEKILEAKFADFAIQSISSVDNIKAQTLANKALATRKSLNIVEQNKEVGETDSAEDGTNGNGVTWHVHDRDPIQELKRNPQKPGRWKSADDPSKSAVIDPSKLYLLRFDGGSRGNPGVAGAGMVIYDENGQEIWCGWHYYPKPATNNVAEYIGVVCGLKCVKSLGIKRLVVEGDSQLIVKQMNGTYRTREETLLVFQQKALQLVEDLEYVEIRHIPRAENKRADWLANHAMDLQESHGFELFGKDD